MTIQTPNPNPAPHIVRSRCLHERHNASSCCLCTQVCPSQALSFQAGVLALSQTDCTGCGACAAVCPAEAFAVNAPTDEQLMQSITQTVASGQLRIACACSAHSQDCLEVACLRRLDPSLLLLACRGGQTELICGTCADCPRHAPGHTPAQQLDQTRQLAALVGAAPQLKLTKQPAAVDFGRRFLWKRWTQRALSEPTAMPEIDRAKICEAARAAKGPSLKHLRLVAALRVLVSMKGRTVPACQSDPAALDTFKEPRIRAELCNGCALCADVCPTQALHADSSDGQTTLYSNASLCMNCRLCADVCCSNAVSFNAVSSVDAVFNSHDTVLVRKKSTAENMTATFEDKIRQLISVPVYRT